jgi:transglutaminase-like putative cysteine protease
MAARSPRLRFESDRLDDHLVADAVIDHHHPSIRESAVARDPHDDITHDDTAHADTAHADTAVARAAFEFVRDEVSHSADVGEWSAAYVASDVLRERNGICHAKSHLLAALLRARGIPTGFCYSA